MIKIPMRTLAFMISVVGLLLALQRLIDPLSNKILLELIFLMLVLLGIVLVTEIDRD